MKIDFKKIINIKKKQDLKDFSIDKPIFQSNYLFHYLIILNNLDGLKLIKYPVYIENNDKLNGFHLAAKENHISILIYLIKTYPEYIYNRNSIRNPFTTYLEMEKFSILINKFPKLNWKHLIEETGYWNGYGYENQILKIIIANLSFKELQKFIKVYKPTNKTSYLECIIKNNLLNEKEKITILNEFTDEEINIKNEKGEGLIIHVLNINDKILFDYLLDRNIDLDYYSIATAANPLLLGIINDRLNNEYNYSKKIIKKIINNNKYFYNEYYKYNRYIDNLAHSTIYLILNTENKDNKDNTLPGIEILKLCDNKTWNQINIENKSPLELLINLDYDVYSKIIKDNKISINIDILSKIKQKNDNKNNDNDNYNKWIKLYQTLPNYIQEPNSVIIDNTTYSHYTAFRSRIRDSGIFMIYLRDTYEELLIPNMKTYLINNLTFEDTLPFPDKILKEQVFPWQISYYSETEYYIHPYLNNLINAERRNNNKRYAAVLLSLINDKMLHANILVYDFKNMTVERFEPYGNTNIMEADNILDNVLEEELTWNTGLKYLRPCDFLPYAGFQFISDENNLSNIKPGDFGGFCLAWCFWYLETKLKNQDIDSNILVTKLINKISKLEINFAEYIRNYSTKINDYRINYLKKIGLDEKEISDSYVTLKNDNIIKEYLLKEFN
jgi:hypothetical protein